jgi:acetylornithine deacetylase/succinyl-diaminopimelate desuccinylase-like protein
MGMPKASPPDAGLLAELAQAPGVRECLQWVVKERPWINEQHLQVCRIPAPTFLEGKRADWMVTQFRALGYDARIDRAGNVVAQADPSHKGPYIAVTAHLDTVLAPRAPEEIKVQNDGSFKGPGVSDNGAGLAALLAVARALKSAPRIDSASSPLFVANVGEEGEGNLSGMRYLCRQSSLASRIRAFLILDGPTTDHITCQALASRRFEIAFLGSGGHSWSDFGIGNPVHALSRGIALFVDDPSTRIATPRTSYNFGVIDGGSSINSIPTEARTKVDIRSESPGRIDELVELLSSCIDRSLQVENDRSIGGRVTARFKELGSRPGGRLPDDAPLLRYIRAVDHFLGIRSHLDCASTDANIPLSMGLPAISIGAGGQGGGAHTPNEWFHPDGREVGLKRVLLALFCLLLEP